jgi:acetyl-CoA carboxylase carboxyl transferase subunit alpha
MLYEDEGRSESCSPPPGLTRLNGYQKTQHLFRLAQKFRHPIVVFAGSPSSLPDVKMTKPDEALRFANHIHSQWHLEVPIILVVLSRKVSGNIFGAWLADKVLAFEETCFSMAMLDQGENHLVRLGARHLLHQGIIDGTISESVCNGHGSPVVMPKPRQLRIALDAILEELSCVSPGQLLLRRKEKIERVSALKLEQYGLGEIQLVETSRKRHDWVDIK